MELGGMQHVLASRRFIFDSEAELQEKIYTAFRPRWNVRREVVLRDGRADLFVEDRGIIIEVKTKGAGAALVRQIDRYAKYPEVRGVLVISSLMRLTTNLPTTLHDKPVRSWAIMRAFA